MKMKLIKDKDDQAFRMKVGEVFEYNGPPLLGDIVNIKGAHFRREELSEYFEFIFDEDSDFQTSEYGDCPYCGFSGSEYE